MRPTLAIYGVKDIGDGLSNTHDHNLCVMHNGKVQHYLHLERYSRKKYDNRLDLYIEELFEKNIIDVKEDFDLVFVNSFVGNSFQSNKGLVKFESKVIFPNPPSLIQNCFSRFELTKYKVVNSYMLSHELAHVFGNTLFYGDIIDNSLLVHYDGGASVSNFSSFYKENGKLRCVDCHWDFKYLTSFYNNNILSSIILENDNFSSVENEALDSYRGSIALPGKLMGYSSYGKYSKHIEEWLEKHNFFESNFKSLDTFLKILNKEFGTKIKSINNKFQIFKDIIATMQFIFEREFIKCIKQLQKDFNAKNLYYSGGSALNIKLNHKLVQLDVFENIYIPPICEDSGLSLGAAAFVENLKGNSIQKHKANLNNVGNDIKEWDYSNDLVREVVENIINNKVLGFAFGNSEAGPRALGNRSIIARPDSLELTKRISQDIKKREWYRPIAPIMLKEIAEMVTGNRLNHLAHYMLSDFNILPQFRAKLEGVVHTDDTCRIQIIEEKNDNPFLFDVLTELYKNYKILGIINTSFNAGGRPIVHSYKEVLNTAKDIKLDGVIINGELIEI